MSINKNKLYNESDFVHLIVSFIFYTFIFIFLIIFCFSDTYASAWSRKQNEIFGVFEFLDESDCFETLANNINKNFYRTNSYKIYLEYGLTKNFTIGGYIKNYNFFSRHEHENIEYIKKINNDYYFNLFFLQNLYNKNDNLFTLQYSTYIPIKYDNTFKNVNVIDRKYAFEFGMLYGKDGKVDLNFININFKYFLDASLAYKLINNFNYDQINFGTTLGIRFNTSSTFSLYYEHQYFLDKNLNNNYNIYNYYNNYDVDQIKACFNYKFLDNLSTEFAYYRKFSKTNSSGFIFAFIFNYN